MIDADDVGNGFAFGGLVVGLIFLAIYFYYSKPVIETCHDKGGQIVRIEGQDKCMDTSVLKEVK